MFNKIAHFPSDALESWIIYNINPNGPCNGSTTFAHYREVMTLHTNATLHSATVAALVVFRPHHPKTESIEFRPCQTMDISPVIILATLTGFAMQCAIHWNLRSSRSVTSSPISRIQNLLLIIIILATQRTTTANRKIGEGRLPHRRQIVVQKRASIANGSSRDFQEWLHKPPAASHSLSTFNRLRLFLLLS